MSNDEEGALPRLWREKRGEGEPEDLSGNLIVQLGVVTEQLNRHWYERNTGQVITEVQRRVNHPVIKWMAAALDGMIEATGAVFEAKFMLPWSFFEEVAAEGARNIVIGIIQMLNRSGSQCRSSLAKLGAARFDQCLSTLNSQLMQIYVV
jgi:hypothetical protein